MGTTGHVLAGIGGIALIVLVLRDAFATMILPRRLNGRFRFTQTYFRAVWPLFARFAESFGKRRRRDALLSLFGPLSMLLLFVLWEAGLIFGFGLFYFGLHSGFRAASSGQSFGTYLYLSGTTLLTLGMGDVIPVGAWARVLVVIESGMGFGFIGVIISYLPVLYSGFAARESHIIMLDARAGSPASASELLRRAGGNLRQLETYLADWERWSAQLLESQISYPVLGFFRSQHANQSWLAALTTILDSSAFLMVTCEDSCTRQARLTFAMARHAVVDLAQVFIRRLPGTIPERLSPEQLDSLAAAITRAGTPVRLDAAAATRLAELRRLYEPHVFGIGAALRLDIPHFVGDPLGLDNWQRSPWEHETPAWLRRGESPPDDQHF